MLQRIIGYAMAGIGFLGYGYFRYYKGTIIPYSTVWLFVSVGIGLLGFYIATSKPKVSKQEIYNKELLKKLKQSGEKIILTNDNCEIRENSYYEEQINESLSRSEEADALYDPNRNYKQNYIEQSAIIYQYSSGDKNYRMVSQSFPVDAETLSRFIWNGSVLLYVNSFNKAEYVFELSP